jgi:ubiquinone/menaquinone biosynthesis C-methylase UbiE
MSKKLFDPKKLEKLHNPIRLDWIPPQLISTLLNLSEGTILADLGAGSGFFTEAILVTLPSIQIHALDIQNVMLDYMREHRANNIIPALIKNNLFPLEDHSVDAAWCINVFHEIDDLTLFLAETKRILKPGNPFLLIDWDPSPEACHFGPPADHRKSADKAISAFEQAQFKSIKNVSQGFTYHYAIKGLA